MVYTIAPAVRRKPTMTGWGLIAGPYVVGSIIGGAATGTLVGGTGMVLRSSASDDAVLLAIFALVCLIAIMRDLLRPACFLPSLQRQVPVRWRANLPLGYATFLYGVQLGLGWATHVYFGSYYILLSVIFLEGSAKYGLLIHATYGLARSAAILAFPNTSADQTNARLQKLGRLRGHAGWMSAFGSAVAAVAILIGIT